jgi:hypothetical protein
MPDKIEKIHAYDLVEKMLEVYITPRINEAALSDITAVLKDIPGLGNIISTVERTVFDKTNITEQTKQAIFSRLAMTIALYHKLFPKKTKEKIEKIMSNPSKIQDLIKNSGIDTITSTNAFNISVSPPTPMVLEGPIMQSARAFKQVEKTTVLLKLKEHTKNIYTIAGHLTDEGVSFQVQNKFQDAGGGMFGQLFDMINQTVIAVGLAKSGMKGMFSKFGNIVKMQANEKTKDGTKSLNANTQNTIRFGSGALSDSWKDSGVIGSIFVKSPIIYKGTEPLKFTIKMNLIAYKNIDLIEKTIKLLENSVPGMNNDLIQAGVWPPQIDIVLYGRLYLKNLLIESVETSFKPPFISSGKNLTPVVVPVTITARTPMIVDARTVRSFLSGSKK